MAPSDFLVVLLVAVSPAGLLFAFHPQVREWVLKWFEPSLQKQVAIEKAKQAKLSVQITLEEERKKTLKLQEDLLQSRRVDPQQREDTKAQAPSPKIRARRTRRDGS